MVYVTKLPSEFSTSKMRDSFLRQFVDQGGEFELLARQNQSNLDQEKPLTKYCHIPLIRNPQDKSRIGTATQKSGIVMLIR